MFDTRDGRVREVQHSGINGIQCVTEGQHSCNIQRFRHECQRQLKWSGLNVDRDPRNRWSKR